MSNLTEPINRRDRSSYYLNEPSAAHTVIEIVGEDNLRLQLDLYHCQIMEGDLCAHIDASRYLLWIGCGYLPANGIKAGLGWFEPYRNQ